MVTKSPVINELELKISTVRGELNALEEEFRIKTAKQRKLLEALELVLDSYLQNGATPQTAEVDRTLISKIRGLSQTKALDIIAECNDGLVHATTAKHLLIEAGLARGKARYVLGHIYQLLGKSDRYERVKPGVFRRRSLSREQLTL